MAWSAEQLAAITTYDKNLLVAAAAGSGKTSVLVERIIRRILDEAQEFQIDQVLVVTFTNAAAAEMRERIGAAIVRALRENPRSRHLERQLALLNAASISTLHAFCQQVIRRNFHLLDLDPKFRLMGEQEGALLKQEVLETLFEERYATGDAAFLDFVDHYGSERGDEELYEIVLRLYAFSRSQPFPEAWLAALARPFELPAGSPVDATVWAELIKRELRLLFAEGAARSRALGERAEALGCDFYQPVFAADAALYEALAEAAAEGWDALRRAVCAVKFPTLRAPKGTDEALKEYFSKRRGRLKDKLKQAKETYFAAESGELIGDLGAARPLMETVCSLTAAFAAAFAAAKKRRALVDFSDLEHFCLRILCGEDARPERLTPSPAAAALREKYREIMVDEYQDINDVQEAILSLVRRPDEPNLFLVGDVKQSIYRFRLAEPELFLAKYRSYPDAADCVRIDLAQNFRSRGGVLAAINFIFAQVMSPEIAELSYGPAERLNPGPEYPDAAQATLAGPVELHLIGRDEAAAEAAEGEAAAAAELRGFAAEARLIAGRLRELMVAEMMVFDKAERRYRPLAWRDIAILLRSVKGKADVLLEALRAADIPAYASDDGGYFAAVEVQVMLALLQTIDNPRQDIPLASVLYSPMVGMSAEALAKLRLLQADGALYDALLRACGADAPLPGAVKDQAAAFAARLHRWRTLARRRGVPELIWQLFRDTGYYDHVGGMPGGVLRQANLRMLYDRARAYEKTNFRGLFRFLRFIEKMRGAGTDLAVARTLGENENVVRIMSVHKSKGLEFPVAVVADLGKKFNLQDSRAAILLHKKLGLGPYVTRVEPRLRYPTIARQAIAAQMNRESKAEELRVLYVALTRAREKLILVGSAARLASRADGWCRYADAEGELLPDYAIAGAECSLDWICSAVARHEDGAPLRALGGWTGAFRRAASDDSPVWRVSVTAAADLLPRSNAAAAQADWLDAVRQERPLPGSARRDWVERVLNWQYPHAAAARIPAKLSVTELKRRLAAADETAAPLFASPLIAARPRFMQDRSRLTGAEYGTLLHSFMQHVDLAGDLSAAGLERQLAALVSREIILPEQAPRLDLSAAARFFSGDLGRRMAASANVRRELPFGILLPANRFYPELDDGAERIFVQGIVDVLFEENDGLVLLDYKTDGGRDVAAIADRYRLQVGLYAEAVERILGRRVKERYLYLLSAGCAARL